MKSSDIHIRAITQEMPQPSITKIHLKITYVIFHSNFPRANKLTHWYWIKMGTILLTTLSNVLYWIKIFAFQIKFPWILLPMLQLTIRHYWLQVIGWHHMGGQKILELVMIQFNNANMCHLALTCYVCSWHIPCNFDTKILHYFKLHNYR